MSPFRRRSARITRRPAGYYTRRGLWFAAGLGGGIHP
jgi:hypothetical protein